MSYVSGVYLIKNNINDRLYIGSAVNLFQRKQRHFFELSSGVHKNKHLQNAWNKYGKDNFFHKILLYCDVDKLLFFEQRTLDYYKSLYGQDFLYNKNMTADSMQGYKLNDEQKAKLKLRLMGNLYSLGRKLSDEHKAKLSIVAKETNTGRKHSEEIRKRMSLAHIGNIPSANTRGKLSEATKKSWLVEDIRNKRSQALRGRIMSRDTRTKISSTLMGHCVSNETRLKQSESHRGKPSSQKGKQRQPLSEEHRMKIANSMRDYRKKVQGIENGIGVKDAI